MVWLAALAQRLARRRVGCHEADAHSYRTRKALVLPALAAIPLAFVPPFGLLFGLRWMARS
jgi:hypothetical protein